MMVAPHYKVLVTVKPKEDVIVGKAIPTQHEYVKIRKPVGCFSRQKVAWHKEPSV